MNIIHILPGYFSDGWTYQENLLTKWQHKNGHNVTLITSMWTWNSQGTTSILPEEKHDYVNSDGVRIIRLKYYGVDRFSMSYDELYRTVESCKPDILFIHDVVNTHRALVEYLQNHREVTAYADNHSDFSNAGDKFSIRFQAKRITGLLSRNVRPLIPYVKKFYGVLPARVEYLNYVLRVPKEKCALLLMGADDDLAAEAAKPEVRRNLRERYGILPEDFLIVTGGKIDTAKTQTLLLMQAVKNIAARHVKLLIFGPVVPELQESFESLVDGTVIQHVPFVEGKDTYSYFAAADLAVFPGRHSVFWEQVAGQGIPMICKKWAGTTHVDLGGNVRFLKRDSVRVIQREIERLLDNPEEYRLMKQIAEREGMKTFSYRNIARQSIEG